MSNDSRRRPDHDRLPGQDRGTILPLAMVFVLVLGLVGAAVAGYVTANFRSTQVTIDRTDRLAAAEAGLTVAIDRLQLRQTLCTTGAAEDEFRIEVPAPINGATVVVNCRRSGTILTDIQGWAAVVTGEGVPSEATFSTQGGGEKSIGGPIYLHNPNRISISGGLVTMVNGDVWYQGNGCSSVRSNLNIAGLTYSPVGIRGPICTAADWRTIFAVNPPPLPVRPAALNPPFNDSTPGCRVFQPGTYTSVPSLANQNYFAPGDYYFENIGQWTLDKKVLAGLPAGHQFNDEIVLSTATNCITALQAAQADPSAQRGATFVLGGNSRITIPSSGGELEIMRRPQGGSQSLVSIIAVTPDNVGTQPGYVLSSVPISTPIIDSSSGNNTNLIIHGVFWAPYSYAVLSNVTNNANGQLLGGAIVAKLHLQSSGSASGFVVQVDPSPQRGDVILEATATDAGGRRTMVRAVVEFNPDSGATAVNSWRVLPTFTP